VAKVVKEVDSGINGSRPKLLALLADQRIGVVVIEHKDRLTRFGFRHVDAPQDPGTHDRSRESRREWHRRPAD
jgi:predicted site-specific integrase-resolvase